MEILKFLLALLVLIGLAYGLYSLYLWWIKKQAGQKITAQELESLRIGAQIIDVREQAEFDARHIMGARNIPMSVFSGRVGEIRKDKPVYLYDDNEGQVARAANMLKKAGHTQIFYLEKGFSTWTGKTKTR